MDPDPLKAVWNAQPPPAIDAGRLLADLHRDGRRFASAVFWRDVREVGVAVVMVPVWIAMGVSQSLPWTWYLMVPALVWVAGFLLADRVRHPQRPPDPGEPLLRCAEAALARVEHQIRLLRGVGRWYLLPLAVPMLAFVGHVNWRLAAAGWVAAVATVAVGGVLGLVLAGVYRLNQIAVRDELEPRRRELEALVAGLREPSG